MIPLLALLACSDPQPPLAEGPVAVRSWLEGKPGAGGLLVVQTAFDPGGKVDFPDPKVEGLAFTLKGQPQTEQIGDRTVVTAKYGFTGQKGSYEIPALAAHWDGPEQDQDAASVPLWVDVGVPPPREGEIADIVDPGRVWTIPWVPILATTAAGATLVGLAAFAFRRVVRRPPPVTPPEPPDVVALRRWEAVRSDPALDDHEKCVRLAAIFRDYAEVVLGFPATASTTTEILERLGALPHLPQGNIPRARRLLRATDRVKFAEDRPGTDLFGELDADLRAFVGSTRPQSWSAP